MAGRILPGIPLISAENQVANIIDKKIALRQQWEQICE
jgi:hypothetical protein